MKNIDKKYFNLSILIEKAGLNIRKVASNSKNLTVGEYFDMLSDLMEKSSLYSDDILRLINRDVDRKTYKELSRMQNELTSLGYEKHGFDFESMRESYEMGHPRLASVHTKTVLDEFNELCTQIAESRITAEPTKYNVDPYKVTLKDWIERRKIDSALQKPVILAIDDSPVILKSVISLLSDDYKVYTLTKSSMLEKTLSQIKPDMFLLDYNMPVVNGFELIPIIRGYEEHKETPVIFLTSEGTVDNLTSAVMLGACDFIAKPVKPDILRERINKHMESKLAS